MTDGENVECGPRVEVLYQAGYDDGCMLPEAAIILQHYDQSGPVFGIIQGDQEITVGGARSMRQLGKALLRWAKEKA